jgi:hypothetical protein
MIRLQFRFSTSKNASTSCGLGADMEIAWSHPAATMATRKRIVRTVLREIIVRVEDGFVDMVLHWQGGDHTALKIKKNACGKHRWTVRRGTPPSRGRRSRGQARPVPGPPVATRPGAASA